MNLMPWLSPVIRVVGMVIPPIQKYFNQPKLYFKMQWNSTFKGAGLLSRKNENKPLQRDEAVWVSPIEWNYTITIRNNSEYAAYNLKLLQPATNSNVIITPPLDDLKPILSHGEISYDITLRVRAEGKSKELEEKMNARPEEFEEKQLVLEYTNSKNVKYYTIFDYSGDSNGTNRVLTEYEYNLIHSRL